jgi:hypothetical protein
MKKIKFFLFSILFKIGQRFLIFFSRIAKIIYWQKIQVEEIRINPALLIENNPMYLSFKIEGCYKIKIKSVGSFVGTEKVVKINTPSTGELEIKFYGRNKKEKRKIRFEVVKFQNVKIPEKLEISPFKVLQNEQFKNLNRVDLVYGIKSFENSINEQLYRNKIINENLKNNILNVFQNTKPSLNKELEVKKINIKIDKSIIESYEKNIL